MKQAYEVPLVEQLESVPNNARLVIDDADGMGTRYIPVGRMCHDASKALRQAIAEAEKQEQSEPVAEVTSETGAEITMSWWHEPALPIGTKLYTTPQKRTWVGLTEEEILKFQNIVPNTLSYDLIEFAKAIEAKLKEKNT